MDKNPSGHIPDKKLRETAVRILEKPGFVTLPSILNAKEASHFRECGECIGALAKIAGELSRENNPEKRHLQS